MKIRKKAERMMEIKKLPEGSSKIKI